MVKILLDTGIGEIVELKKNNFEMEERILHVVDNYLWKFDDTHNFTIMDCTCKGETISPNKVLTPQHEDICVKLTFDLIHLQYQFEKSHVCWSGTVKCGQTDNILKVLKRELKKYMHPETFQVKSVQETMPDGITTTIDEYHTITDGAKYMVTLIETHLISFEFIDEGATKVVEHEAVLGDLLWPIAINILKKNLVWVKGQTRIYQIIAPRLDWHSESFKEMNVCSEVYKAAKYRIVWEPVELPAVLRRPYRDSRYYNIVQKLQNQFYEQFDTKIDQYFEKVAGKVEKSSETPQEKDDQVVDRLADVTAQLENVASSLNRPTNPKESEEYQRLDAEYRALGLQVKCMEYERQLILRNVKNLEVERTALLQENESLKKEANPRESDQYKWLEAKYNALHSQHDCWEQQRDESLRIMKEFDAERKELIQENESLKMAIVQKQKECENWRRHKTKFDITMQHILRNIKSENFKLKRQLKQMEYELLEKEMQVGSLTKQLQNEKKEKKVEKEEKREEKEEKKEEKDEKQEEKEAANEEDESSGAEDFDIIDENFIDADSSVEDN